MPRAAPLGSEIDLGVTAQVIPIIDRVVFL